MPPDLLAIVRKAMAFDRAQRYPTAASLAEDLQRFQTGQLVGSYRKLCHGPRARADPRRGEADRHAIAPAPDIRYGHAMVDDEERVGGRNATGVEPTLALPVEAARTGNEATLVLPADRPGTEHTMLAVGSDPAVAKGSDPGVLDTVSQGARTAADASEPERYVVLDEIGRGGLGRVVRAKDRKLDRTVAIKQLHHNDPGTERRFMGEALVTARLQHPSIVPIYDTGREHEGEPFYAMKLIAGRSLAEVIEGAETVAARLALVPAVLAVANAIAFAHHEKVIHRDLKPANVIIGEFGETVVIDWGLAKQLGEPDSVLPRTRSVSGDQTLEGDVLGTPAYMAPEQARGESLDERADVFALGAILYHALAGRPPYAGGRVEITLGLARLGKSPALETLVPEAPPDLIAIVRKAMAFDPAERYATAAKLADDLQKYLTGQLVGSYRYTSWQLLRRWVRRHRGAVTVGAVLVTILAIASTVFVRQIQHERDVADEQRIEAETQRVAADRRKLEAETRRGAAEDLVGFMLSDLKPGLTRLGRIDLMRGVAKQVDAYYERVKTVDDLDPAAIGRRAEAIRTMGEVLDIAGEVAPARRAFETAIALLSASPASAKPAATAHAQIDLALTLQEQGDLDGAAALLGRVQSSLASQPASAAVDFAFARMHRRAAIIELSRGKLAEAAIALRSGIVRGRAAAKASPKAREIRKELAAGHDRLSDTLNAMGDLTKAIEEARAGLAIREELGREDPGDIELRQGLSVSWDKIYNLSLVSRDFDRAQRAADASLAIAELLGTIDPDNDDWARQLVIAAGRPAQLAWERDDFAGAVRKQERPLALAQQRVDRDPTSLSALEGLSDALAGMGNYLTFAKSTDRAIEVLRRAQKVAEELARRVPDNVEYKLGLATLHEYIGDVFATREDARAAADEYRARMAIDDELLRLDPANPRLILNLASSRFRAGTVVAYVKGQHEEGIALMQRGLDTILELKRTGQLTPDMESTIPEREKILAAAKRAR